MAPIFLGIIAFGLILLFLALFARGGAREPSRPREGARVGIERLIGLTEELLKARGWTVEELARQPDGRADIIAIDPRPVFGQRLYLRIAAPLDGSPVEEAEVQAAIDRLKEGGLHKGLVISDTGFSDEALTVATETAVELVDAAVILAESRAAEPRHIPPLTPQPART